MTTIYLGIRLARSGSLRRALLIVLGVALGTVVLLATAAVPETFESPSRDTIRLLEISTASLCVPVISLLAAVVRVSAGARDRRLSALRILGVSATATRAAAAVETLTLAVGGVFLGSVAYLGLRPTIEAADPAGDPWFHGRPLLPSAIGWAAVVGGVLVVSVVVAVSPARAVTSSPLTVRRQGSAPRPGWWRLPALPAGIALLLYVDIEGPLRDTTRLVPPFLVGVAMVGIGLPLAVPVLIRRSADLVARLARRPGLVLAARRTQQEPAGSSRLVATLLVALFVVTGARCVLVVFQTQPDVIRVERALSSGPQGAVAFPTAHPHLDLAALRRVPGVRDVGTTRYGSLACTPDERRELTTADGTACDSALVADCAAVRALVAQIAHCPEGPYWVVTSDFGLSADALRVRPVVTDDSGKSGQQHEMTLPLVTDVVHLPDGPASDPDWMWNAGPALILPPTAYRVAAMLARGGSRPQLVADLDGGSTALHNFVAAARRQGFQYQQELDEKPYHQLRTYTALLWVASGVLLGLGLIALLVTGYDRAVERRRHVAALAVVGVPIGVSRRSQLMQIGAPLLIGIPAALACGVVAGDAYLALDSSGSGPHTWVPWHDVLTFGVIATVAGAAVAAFTVVGLGRRVRPAELRRE